MYLHVGKSYICVPLETLLQKTESPGKNGYKRTWNSFPMPEKAKVTH